MGEETCLQAHGDQTQLHHQKLLPATAHTNYLSGAPRRTCRALYTKSHLPQQLLMAYKEGPCEAWNFDLPESCTFPQLPESCEPPSPTKKKKLTIVRILCPSVFVILVPGIVPGALCMLGKRSTTGLCIIPQPHACL